MTLFENGHAERTKACVHGALGTLALVCATYNLIAWLTRGDRHLGRNALVYSALTAYEIAKVQHHCAS